MASQSGERQMGDGDERDAVDDTWNDVAARRLREVLSGEVEMVDGEETLAMARFRITCRRR